MAYFFFIALAMEVINLFSMYTYSKKSEENPKKRMEKQIKMYKELAQHAEVREANANKLIEQKKNSIYEYKINISIMNKRNEALKEELDELQKKYKELEKILTQRTLF